MANDAGPSAGGDGELVDGARAAFDARAIAGLRVLVCGSREWDDANVIDIALLGCNDLTVGPLVVVEGGARGADDIAGKWAEDWSDVEHLCFPAKWDDHGKAAGPIRNQQMIDEGKPDLVLAFKDGFDWSLRRGGTEDMVRRAKAAGVPTYVVSRA